jgi:hypothetical protein
VSGALTRFRRSRAAVTRLRERASAATAGMLLPAVAKDVTDNPPNGRGNRLVPLDPASFRRDPQAGAPQSASVKGRSPRASALDPSAEGERRAILQWDTEVDYVPVEWLWQDWIVGRNLNVLAGDGGVGKTHFAVGLAARLSRGDLPGDHNGVPGSTLYLSAEDDFASHLKKLYRAAGGVPGRFARMKVAARDWLDDPVFPDDLPELRRLVRDAGVALVVIDPGSAFFSVRDSHNDQQMRTRVFGPLASLAMGENVTVLFVAHLNKGGGTFRQRINGAVGLSNAPRSVVGMARDSGHEDRSVVAHVKGNLAKAPGSLIFEFVETAVQIDGQDAPATWLKRVGTSGMTADDLVAPMLREKKADVAVALLCDALAAGPIAAKELDDLAAANGISHGTLAEARKRVDVVSRRDGKGWLVGYAREFDEQ